MAQSPEATHLIAPEVSPQQALTAARLAEARARRRWPRVNRAVTALQQISPAPVSSADTPVPLARPA
jgi:hypothetical protein